MVGNITIMPVKINRITYNLLTIASLIVYTILLITSHILADPLSAPLSALPKSFAYSKTSSSNSLGSFEGSQTTASILRMHNATGTVVLVGDVNPRSLEMPRFKPLIEIDSHESYLTKNYEAYKIAKNQSELMKPNTTVVEVKPGFFHDIRLPKIPRTNLNISNSILGAFQGLSQNCCFPPDVQVAAGKKYLLEMVNLDGAIYTKGGSLVKAFGLERFFNPSVGSNIIHEMTDPLLLFDNRFAASPDPINGSEIWIAGEYHAMPTWSTYIGELHIS